MINCVWVREDNGQDKSVERDKESEVVHHRTCTNVEFVIELSHLSLIYVTILFFFLKHYVTILLPLHFRVKKHKQEAKAKKNSSSFLLLCFAFLLLIFFLANKRNSRSCEFVIHIP